MTAYVVADAFSSIPFAGNPVAVFVNAQGWSAARMQRIAREMNLSETTFVLPPQGSGDVRIRIFTPVNELPFAGHPMLGTAFVLGQDRADDKLSVETAMGIVPITFGRVDGRITHVSMRQPIPTWQLYPERDTVVAALGVPQPDYPVEAYRNGPRHVFVHVRDEDTLAQIRPDLRMLSELTDMSAICFTGRDDAWTLRMFSPAYGVTEDAATGSAAGPLAIHVGRHGLAPWSRRLTIRQGSQIGRPSTMYGRAVQTGGTVTEVEVSGEAVIVARGELLV